MKNFKIPSLVESKIALFGDPGCDDVEEILSNKVMEPINQQKSSDSNSEEEDELKKIFEKVLTKKTATKKQCSLGLMEKNEDNFAEEHKNDDFNQPKLKLMKTKSFFVKPSESILKIGKNDNKTKEN